MEDQMINEIKKCLRFTYESFEEGLYVFLDSISEYSKYTGPKVSFTCCLFSDKDKYEIYYQDIAFDHAIPPHICRREDITATSSFHIVSDTLNYLTLNDFQIAFCFGKQENPFMNYILASYANFTLEHGIYGGNVCIPALPRSIISKAVAFLQHSDFDIHTLTQISSLDYEGDKCKSQIAFIPPEKDDDLNLRLTKMEVSVGFQPEDATAIRKLLQLTGDNLCLFMSYWSPSQIGPDGSLGIHKPLRMIGIGEYKLNKQKATYLATIHGFLNWTLYKDDYPVLKFVKGSYMLPAKEKTDTLAEIKKKLKKEMKTTAQLNKILDAAKKQRHGTTLVISDDAQKEARRLCRAARG